MIRRFEGRQAALVLAALVVLLGAGILTGWRLDVPALVQILPAWPPVQFNAALGLVLLGLGTLAVWLELRPVALMCALPPFLIGSATLVSWVAGLHPGIDQIFHVHQITTLTVFPGRMPSNNALSLVIGAVALGVASLPATPARASIAGLLACVLAFRGLTGTVYASLEIADWVPVYAGTTRLSVLGSIVFLLQGAALWALVAKSRHAATPEQRSWEVPLLGGLLVGMASLLMWQGLSVAESTRLRVGARDAMSQVIAALQTSSQSLGETVGRAARRLGRESDVFLDREWTLEARDYFRGNAWLQEVVHLGADGTVRARVSRDAGLSLPELPAWTGYPAEPVEEPAQAQHVFVWRHAGSSRNEDPIDYLVVPFAGPLRSGALAFGVRTDALFSDSLEGVAASHVVRLNDGNGWEFTRGDGTVLPATDAIVAERTLEFLFGLPWHVEVVPGVALVRGQQAMLPRIFLTFGAVLAVLTTLVLRYAAQLRVRAVAAIDMRARLEHEVETRRAAESLARDNEERARQALAEVQQILHQSQDLICTVDRDGRFLVVSDASFWILGYRPEEMVGRRWLDFVHPDDVAKTREEVADIRQGKVTTDFQNRYMHRSGRIVQLSWTSTWRPGEQRSYSIARDVTARDRAETVREGQRQVLEQIAGGAGLIPVLDAICRYVERMEPGSLCSILLVEDGAKLRTAAGPSLPADYTTAIDGIAIGQGVGCCGTAAWSGQLVVTEDIDVDPLWSKFRGLATRVGLRACWSMPIKGEQGAVLGTFAIYQRTPAVPGRPEIEIIEVAAGLAAVAIERDQANARLLEGREQLEFARRIAQLGYWAAYEDGDRVTLSPDMVARLGLPQGEDQQFSRLLQFVVPEDRAVLSAARQAAFRHDVPVDTEIRLVLPTGETIHVHFLGRCVRDRDGVLLRLAGTVQDITSRKLIELENSRLYAELEERVRRRTRELELSNRELEAFSYSVSHDLRAPLRAIAGFSALLRDEFAETVGPRGRHYLERIMAGTSRMSGLIDGLLELGRVSRVALNRQPIDLSALAVQVGARLHERWPDRHVDLDVQPELVAWGDLRLIEVVLENLLENAWKFTGVRPVGHVRVGQVDQQGETVYFVADDGVGFDPQYAANLFGVFQRLHPVTDFPGTGVGLATVQRILQRHGGRIWAESQVGRGATFHFTLP